jgi:hypothetical protein
VERGYGGRRNKNAVVVSKEEGRRQPALWCLLQKVEDERKR